MYKSDQCLLNLPDHSVLFCICNVWPDRIRGSVLEEKDGQMSEDEDNRSTNERAFFDRNGPSSSTFR